MEKTVVGLSREGTADAKKGRRADYRSEPRRVDCLSGAESVGLRQHLPESTEYIYMSTFGDVS